MAEDTRTSPHTGGCQYGAIRYEFDAAPLGVWACHCDQCRKQSGSAFGLSMIVPLDALRFNSDEPSVWTRQAASGNIAPPIMRDHVLAEETEITGMFSGPNTSD